MEIINYLFWQLAWFWKITCPYFVEFSLREMILPDKIASIKNKRMCWTEGVH